MKLIATTDYACNIGQCFYRRSHLDEMHKYLASIGVTRHHWIYEPTWDHYGIYDDGFDLLAEAVKSAHAHGIEFYAEIKPFEGGGDGNSFPHTLPFPEGVCALKDIRGIYTAARPFTAANPHFSLKRRPGTYEVKGPVSTIRLVKNDDKLTRIRPEYLSIWISKTNNRFEQYKGPVSFRESVEWRQAYPKSKECRILHLEGLQIPDGYNYILVRCSLADRNGDFTNERGSIIELQSKDGSVIPSVISTGKVDFEEHQRSCTSPLNEKITRYFRLPEVCEIFHDTDKGKWHYQDFYSFDETVRINVPYTLDREGYIAVACGKPEYMLGNLHPIYPEVRAHWLDMIRHCLDKGMDGINIRTANHTRSPEDWEYGFNDLVLEIANGKTDYPTIRRINGDAYTQFLREARDLIKNRGKSISIQLYSQMLMPDNRIGRTNYIPPNFEWQWETWVREIADELEFRGAWTLRPENLSQVIETFGAITREAGKPFCFQGNMKEISFEGPLHFTGMEIDKISKDPSINGFVLYETNKFTRLNKAGQIEGSPELKRLLEKYRFTEK
ncbi:MAG: hypothetical protein A2W90_23800 [Bacteroidetes bacterium GWF2_42_66]|nr:MAG: hypothetical protein A2W92_16470 [Bacteroidetes bacterium GWA2_42_15]OFY00288.1 MAG: hypothetical protein A2W89_13865 [Bacteroidetes bacterium GWE2_42_39]OFY47141.1 MAG: hypothetical protein A2W90_23800 [Bacteroidetes bacterium GWF2_42_66]HAZ02170.1 hypothetical protein [Marinilabiliales bacterium]HBL76676.1 hypothetical protein [Prolixibacteraceae bacterium]